MAFSMRQGITTGGTSREKCPTDEGDLIATQMALQVEGEVGEGASFVRSPKSISGAKPEFGSSHGNNAGASDDMEVQKVENASMADGKGPCRPNNIQANFTAETKENSAGREKQPTDVLPLETDELNHDTAQTEALSTDQNVEVTMTNPRDRNGDFSLVNEEQDKNDLNKAVFSGEPPLEKLESGESPLEKLESSTENNLRFPIDKPIQAEASATNRGSRLDKRKQKEKAFADKDINERMSKDKECSDESVESCNSAPPTRLFSTRNEQEPLTIRNKRAKKQVQIGQGLGTMSFTGQDSSFMNWISNMVKGLNKANHDEASPLALTLSHRNNVPKPTNTGFQTMFQSIRCSNPKEQQEASNSPKTLSANIVADPETCRTSSCSDQNRTSFNLDSISVKEGNKNIDSNPHAEAKLVNPLRSCWVTRFSPKTSDLSDWNMNATTPECSTSYAKKLIPSTCDLIDKKSSEAKENSSQDLVNFMGKKLQKYDPDTEPSFGCKRVRENNAENSIFKSNPSLSSPKLKNPEALASVFASRLDAFKHIVLPEVENNKICKMETCFYCGRSGHVLHDCLDIKEIEREYLMRIISLYGGEEESPCFCIRCFQLDHWAISCPAASATILRHSQVPDGHTSCERENYGPDIGKQVSSSPADNALKEKLIDPLCNLVKRKFSEAPKGVFNAIRKLRLSRTDVLKWMNSRTSLLHLDGFFLRLRLGKWEEGLGGTGYYVAGITGEQREKPPQGLKKPISVNIGGIRCLVETQHISNQDFLEDELMAWWCATMKNGGKVPSEDHLKSKFEEKRRLGF